MDIRRLAAIFLPAFFCLAANAQYAGFDDAYSGLYDSETVSSFKKHVSYITSAAFEGRKAGSEGEKAVAEISHTLQAAIENNHESLDYDADGKARINTGTFREVITRPGRIPQTVALYHKAGIPGGIREEDVVPRCSVRRRWCWRVRCS